MNQSQYNQASLNQAPSNIGQPIMVPQCSVAKALRVPSTIGHLEHSLEQLQKTTEILESRLDTIIRHEPANPCLAGVSQAAPAQMVYEKLEYLSDRFNKVNDRLTNLLQVLEV